MGQADGVLVVQDNKGLWWMGPPEQAELARARQQGYEQSVGPKTFLTASRGLGDLQLKEPTPLLSATPEIRAVDLAPEDWAVVLLTRGVTALLGEQEIANICWESVVLQGGGPVEAAQAVTRAALQRGGKDNLTVIVMRLGWAQ